MFIRLSVLHNTASSQGRSAVRCNKYTLWYLHVRQHLFANKYHILKVCLIVHVRTPMQGWKAYCNSLMLVVSPDFEP